ncbi:hypothetical protein [Euzebya rosea]|uniref:hypothetical protein n=1 Tax=Euzebya rosea TaxID=2052804 RepID=UPI000D3E8367|nr:hypothetical protein [Euzebya rosea]
MAYENTSVAVDKSQSEIRRILRKHGADTFQFGEADIQGTRWAALEFVLDATRVRMRVPMSQPDEKAIKAKLSRARSKTRADFEGEHYEQEERRIWRVLYWSIKARMESVEEGVETFHEAWLAHLVDPATGRTLYETAKVAIDRGDLQVGGPGLPQLMAGS